MRERRRESARAAPLGTYPVASTAARTRSAVFAETL